MRLLILSDLNGATTTALIRGTLDLAARRDDVEVLGLVTTRPDLFTPSRRSVAHRTARRSLIAATSRRMPHEAGEPLRHEVRRAIARAGVPLIVPPAGGVNDPAFVDWVARDLRPDAALSFYCLQIVRRPLLDACGRLVNYHDGRLPAYRGLHATSFSLYAGDPESGFTFHHMDEGVDTGDVLVEGAVPNDPKAGLWEIAGAKAAAAAAALPEVIDAIGRGDPGRPQEGEPGYHSRQDGEAMRDIPDPGALTADELMRRVRAFGWLDVVIDGRVRHMTRLRRADPGRPLTFRTADGATLAPDRLRGLPLRLQRPGG